MAQATHLALSSLKQVSFSTKTDVFPISPCGPLSPSHVGRRMQSARKATSLLPSDASTTIRYHLKTLWLFTYSDLKTIVGPQSFFGILHALCASAFGVDSTQSTRDVLVRVPLVILWTWINLLAFCIGNQRSPSDVQEDAINKPWRPLPAKRLTPKAASQLLVASHMTSFLVSLLIGGVPQQLALVVLGYLYNDLRGGSTSPMYRNLLNGFGYISFGWGAMEVALNTNFGCSPSLAVWFALLIVLITCSIQTLDMYDQEGDRQQNRKTLPLVIGDFSCRCTIAAVVLCWALFTAWYWEARLLSSIAPLSLGIVIARRTLTKTSVKEDKVTAMLWNLWLVTVYFVPLVQSASQL